MQEKTIKGTTLPSYFSRIAKDLLEQSSRNKTREYRRPTELINELLPAVVTEDIHNVNLLIKEILQNKGDIYQKEVVETLKAQYKLGEKRVIEVFLVTDNSIPLQAPFIDLLRLIIKKNDFKFANHIIKLMARKIEEYKVEVENSEKEEFSPRKQIITNIWQEAISHPFKQKLKEIYTNKANMLVIMGLEIGNIKETFGLIKSMIQNNWEVYHPGIIELASKEYLVGKKETLNSFILYNELELTLETQVELIEKVIFKNDDFEFAKQLMRQLLDRAYNNYTLEIAYKKVCLFIKLAMSMRKSEDSIIGLLSVKAELFSGVSPAFFDELEQRYNSYGASEELYLAINLEMWGLVGILINEERQKIDIKKMYEHVSEQLNEKNYIYKLDKSKFEHAHTIFTEETLVQGSVAPSWVNKINQVGKENKHISCG
jgi:hypothetical protein